MVYIVGVSAARRGRIGRTPPRASPANLDPEDGAADSADTAIPTRSAPRSRDTAGLQPMSRDAERLRLLDRIAERIPDLDLDRERIEWMTLDGAAERLRLLDRIAERIPDLDLDRERVGGRRSTMVARRCLSTAVASMVAMVPSSSTMATTFTRSSGAWRRSSKITSAASSSDPGGSHFVGGVMADPLAQADE